MIVKRMKDDVSSSCITTSVWLFIQLYSGLFLVYKAN